MGGSSGHLNNSLKDDNEIGICGVDHSEQGAKQTQRPMGEKGLRVLEEQKGGQCVQSGVQQGKVGGAILSQLLGGC